MRDCWLIGWSKDGKIWAPASATVDFTEKDAEKRAKKFSEQARGIYQYRVFKFIKEKK